MSTQANVKLIQDVYAAFGRGDVPFIVSQLTEDVRWLTHMDPVVPWSGDFSGKPRIARFFDAIFSSVDVEKFDPQEWFAEGDTVVSVGEFGCRVRKTGKSSLTRWVFLWRIRNGKICSYEQFHEPSLAKAFE